MMKTSRVLRAIERKIRRYRSFSPATRRAFWRSMLRLPACQLTLHARGFSGYRHLLDSAGVSAKGDVERPSIREIERGYHTALRYLPLRGTCLSRSIALCQLLRRSGHDARLRVGVEQRQRLFGAHAWVELDTQPVGKDSARRQAYHPLLAPRPPAWEASTP